MALNVVALAGGVGGAKMVDGLARNLPPAGLTVVVNIGDDFEHLGLRICPDLDTVLYTLAGLADPRKGWGRADESWRFLETLEALGGPTWFRLGDRDLALHMERTRRLRSGENLSQVMDTLRRKFGVDVAVLPASDDPIPTVVLCDDHERAFQQYFVAEACQPEVRGFRYEGSENAAPALGVIEAIQASDAVVFCPSNPWVSLDPILAVPGIREAVGGKPVVGVSPIIGGQALRGPAAKMYAELGIEPSALAVAQHFRHFLHAILIDVQDHAYKGQIESLGMEAHVTETIMRTMEDREALGGEVLRIAASCLQAEARS